VLGQPPRRLVVRIEADLPLSLAALLGGELAPTELQTLTSSCSFWASAMTFCATCEGTSSYRAKCMW
jgi:hypothetical protein